MSCNQFMKQRQSKNFCVVNTISKVTLWCVSLINQLIINYKKLPSVGVGEDRSRKAPIKSINC